MVKYLFGLLVILTLSSCTPLPPPVHRGKADLSHWDGGAQSVALGGEWKRTGFPGEFQTVPGNWTGGGRPAFGVATYECEVQLPPQGHKLMVRCDVVATSYQFMVNGKLLGGVGQVGIDQTSSRPDSHPAYFEIPEELIGADRILVISMRVANFSDGTGGGINRTPVLGSRETIENQRTLDTAVSYFLSGVLFFIFVYHLMIFSFQRREPAFLLFALVCLLLLVWQLTINEKVYRIFFSLDWLIAYKIEYGSLYATPFTFVLFMIFLFPPRKPQLPLLLFSMGGALLVACVAFTPVQIYSQSLAVFDIYCLAVAIFSLVRVYGALKEKKEGAPVTLAAILVLFATMGNDITVGLFNLSGVFLVPWGILLFALAFTYILIKRFAAEAVRVRELAQRNQALEELDQAKNDFFANSAHELRTPITLLSTPLEALMAGKYGEKVDRHDPIFALMKRSSDRLKRLSEGLLDFLKVDSGTLAPVFTSLDLGAYLETFMPEFTLAAQKRGLSLVLENQAHPTVQADPALLETVVLNLLSNALKFTPAGGTVTVQVWDRGQEGGFTIKDTGQGIPPDQISTLFDRFAAASRSHRSDYSGFGLGLPLSYQMVKLMKGQMSVESVPDQGTAVSLSFSSAQAPPSAAPASRERIARYFEVPGPPPGSPPPSPPVHERKEILIVDDDKDMAAFLQICLGQAFTPRVATSGTEALQLLESGDRPQAIVCDIMMPGLDGLEFREKVLDLPEVAHVPFLFLTAKIDQATRKAGLSLGAVDYITKPFDPDELTAKLQSLTALGRAQKADLEQRLVQAIMSPIPGPGPGKTEGLSPGAPQWRDRDHEIIHLVVQGKTDKEIAGELGCSVRTVSNRVSLILKKTQLSSRTALAAHFAQEKGW